MERRLDTILWGIEEEVAVETAVCEVKEVQEVGLGKLQGRRKLSRELPDTVEKQKEHRSLVGGEGERGREKRDRGREVEGGREREREGERGRERERGREKEKERERAGESGRGREREGRRREVSRDYKISS